MINAMPTAAEETLGYTQKRHKDWFDENSDIIHSQLAARTAAHDALLSNQQLATLKVRYQRTKAET